MAKYREIANEIRRLIRQGEFKPGDLLPSDRALAKRLNVSPHTLRYASDLLCREGLLDRRHGSGTFIRQVTEVPTRKHRLGLLYVDLVKPLHPYSQSLAFGVQAAAFKSGYELVIEELKTDELLKGKVPEMIRRRSVDAVILDGRIRDFHIQFLQDQQMLYLATGDCPLGPDVPQVRVDSRGLAFEITRELLQADYHPIWFDVDPTKGDLWHVDREMFQGYADAIKQFDTRSGSLYLCPIGPDRIATMAETISRTGLKGAAAVFSHWASAMMPAALAARNESPHDLTIVPLPHLQLTQSLHAPNVVQWSHLVEVEETAQQAVTCLLGALESDAGRMLTTVLQMSCRLVSAPRPGVMELTSRWETHDEFQIQPTGLGQCWRHLGCENQTSHAATPAAEPKPANLRTP